MCVYGRQRISKQSFDDDYFKDGLRGSNKSRKMLTQRQLEKYVGAEFAIFVMFLKFFAGQKMILSLGNSFAQRLNDSVTLGNHKGHESLSIDVLATDWDRNIPICVGFVQKPKRADVFFDSTDSSVAKLFDRVLKAQTGHDLQAILACMRSDRAATGVARKVDLEDEACLMRDTYKLGAAAVGKLVRRDMTKKIGSNGHQPYANPFPKSDEPLKKARSMGTNYSTGSRWGGLMALRKSAGMASKLSGTRIKVRVKKTCLVQYELAINLTNAVVDNTRDLRQMPENDTRIAAEHALLMSEAHINCVVLKGGL